jgi:hypothetical protein
MEDADLKHVSDEGAAIIDASEDIDNKADHSSMEAVKLNVLTENKNTPMLSGVDDHSQVDVARETAEKLPHHDLVEEDRTEESTYESSPVDSHSVDSDRLLATLLQSQEEAKVLLDNGVGTASAEAEWEEVLIKKKKRA